MKKRLMSAGSRVRQHGVREYKERNRSSEYQTSKEEIKDTIAAYLLKDEFENIRSRRSARDRYCSSALQE